MNQSAQRPPAVHRGQAAEQLLGISNLITRIEMACSLQPLALMKPSSIGQSAIITDSGAMTGPSVSQKRGGSRGRVGQQLSARNSSLSLSMATVHASPAPDGKAVHITSFGHLFGMPWCCFSACWPNHGRPCHVGAAKEASKLSCRSRSLR